MLWVYVLRANFFCHWLLVWTERALRLDLDQALPFGDICDKATQDLKKRRIFFFFKEENVAMLYWSSFMSLLYCWQSKASILLISFVSRFIAIWFYKLLVQNNSTKSTRLALSVLFTFYREITVQIEGNIADIKGS